MNKKYSKPAMRDLSGVTLAAGSCTSGIGVPNQCVANGFSNGTACVSAGIDVATPLPSCASGYLASACATGTGAA